MTTLSNPRKSDLLKAIPRLRAFAISLSGNIDQADDLVQETLLKAWSNLESFQLGTNMNAWLFTILRNVFYSEFRKRRREVQDSEGTIAEGMAAMPSQDAHMDLNDFQSALNTLPDNQREALVLIGASGMSYEEAAEICGCAIGTIKSRVNRARSRLAEILHIDSGDDFAPDMAWHASPNGIAISHQAFRH